MTDLPSGWATASLGDVVSLRGEKVSPSTSPEAPFLGLEDVEPQTSRVLKYSRSGDFKSAAARFSTGEVLYGRLRPYLNKVLVAETDGLASAEFLVLRSEVDVDFIRRRIMTQEFLAFTALLDRGDRPRVDFEQVSSFKFFLPPLAEQRRIVAKLDRVMARTARARAELARIPALIAHHKRAILAAAFRGDLSANLRAQRTRSDGLPTGWKWATVEALAADVPRAIQSGPFGSNLLHSEFQSSGRLVVGIDNVQDGFFSPGSQNRILAHPGIEWVG